MIGTTQALIVVTLGLPIVLAIAHLSRSVPAHARWSMPLAAAPALLLAAFGDARQGFEIPWLLLGSAWQVDALRKGLLAVTGAIWLLAALQQESSRRSESRSRMYPVFWLTMLAGNLGVVLAADVVSFYGMFALMTFSAWPLIAGSSIAEGGRTTRTYLVYAVLGEALMLAALLGLAADAGSLRFSDVAASFEEVSSPAVWATLLVAGLGVKSAVPGLHSWMPLTYRDAPAPVAAVLGGGTINAGMLGMVSLLPNGMGELESIAATLVVLGIIAAVAAALFGTTQRAPREVLGYSSISQMGLVLMLTGAMMTSPDRIQAAAIVALFAMHHALAKGTLFLTVNAFEQGAPLRRSPGRSLHVLLLVLPALALAGAPLTSGAVAKYAMKPVITTLDTTLPLDALLVVSTVATALVMARLIFVTLAKRQVARMNDSITDTRAGIWLPPVIGVLLVLAMYVVLPGWATSFGVVIGNAPVVASVLPIAIAIVLAWFAWRSRRRALHAPAGDMLVVFEIAGRRLAALVQAGGEVVAAAYTRTITTLTGIQGVFDIPYDRRREADDALRRRSPLIFAGIVVAILVLLWRSA